MAEDLCIDRCVCHGATFADLQMRAEQAEIRTLDGLRADNLCGNGCRHCHPYLRRMLETGETVFRELLPVDDR
jgi:bacterioferritin-associated ferredoxin